MRDLTRALAELIFNQIEHRNICLHLIESSGRVTAKPCETAYVNFSGSLDRCGMHYPGARRRPGPDPPWCGKKKLSTHRASSGHPI
jgi:hypothetical protein